MKERKERERGSGNQGEKKGEDEVRMRREVKELENMCEEKKTERKKKSGKVIEKKNEMRHRKEQCGSIRTILKVAGTARRKCASGKSKKRGGAESGSTTGGKGGENSESRDGGMCEDDRSMVEIRK